MGCTASGASAKSNQYAPSSLLVAHRRTFQYRPSHSVIATAVKPAINSHSACRALVVPYATSVRGCRSRGIGESSSTRYVSTGDSVGGA
eukprot:277398-Rhodomonas_salina.3